MNRIARYIWLIDTLNTHGHLSRQRINELWLRSSLSDGNPLPERTFYHYRRAVEEIFNIEIGCNAAGEYYIKRKEDGGSSGVTDWLLDSYAINNLLSDSSGLDGKVEIEEVPSAREFLPLVINAIRNSIKIRFDYAGFSRSRTEPGITFSPFFLKRYKQRWYMIGRRNNSTDLRTYALDRIKALSLTDQQFAPPKNVSIEQIFGNIVGVTSSKAKERTVKLRATHTQAKYFRALPLHRSQKEELTADDHSIFSYRLKLNYELVHELMSLGDGVKVLEPRELQVMVADGHKKALEQYENFV